MPDVFGHDAWVTDRATQRPVSRLVLWSVWCLAYLLLAGLFLADRRTWQAVTSRPPGTYLGPHFLYHYERLTWFLGLLLGVACLIAWIPLLRKTGHLKLSLVILPVTVFAVTLVTVGLQTTPGRMYFTGLPSGTVTYYGTGGPGSWSLTAAWLTVCAAGILLGFGVVLVTRSWGAPQLPLLDSP